VRIVAQIVAALAIALFRWLETRHEKAKTAQVAERHADALRRIGDRVRAWEDRARDGRLTDADRPGDDGTGVSPD
jgi:seryl-tRNA(Sec) selenium transferase